MKLINILNQDTNVPTKIGSTFNPNFETLKQYGWRKIVVEIPSLQEGYTRIGNPYYILDPDNTDNAIPVVNDILTSVYEEQQRQAQLAAEEAARQAEIQRQIDKDIELKRAENMFLTICEQLTGSKTKLGFSALEALVKELMNTNRDTAIDLTLTLLTIDASGKRLGGNMWWDDVVWHEDIV